jgi:hypothetical protein
VISIAETAASYKICHLLARGRWFSPGTPASSTTKNGRHNIAEILLKVASNTIKLNPIKKSIAEDEIVLLKMSKKSLGIPVYFYQV